MERGFKDVFMNLICIVFCAVGFLITLGLVTKTMIIITGVLAIFLGIFHFMQKSEETDDKLENAFLYIGIISIIFGIIIFITGTIGKDKASYILMIIFFLYGAITSAFANIVKGTRAYKDGESGLRIAYSFIFAVSTILTFLPVAFVIGGVIGGSSIDYYFDSRATYIIALLVISIVPIVALILMIIDYIANSGVSTSYSANRSYNNRRNNHSYESSDYRDRASGPFYNVLSDKCRSVAREFSGRHELSYGRANFDVSVRINRNDITYFIDIAVTSNATSQYEMNELQRTLKYELENVSDRIYNRTETAIDKLRDKYQDFDGSYSINVKVGSVR